MTDYKTIEIHNNEGVARLVFNRPEVLHAMNRHMMDEIIDGLQTIIQDPSVRVAVITGKGKAFMAGADIKEYAAQTEAQFEAFQQNGLRLYELIEQAAIPFIAAVNGFALGGGLEIALACDIIVATESAKMGLPEVHLGLIPGGGGAQRLIQKTGLNRAKEILFFGRSYTAAEMQDFGVVNFVATEEQFAGTVDELATTLKRRPAQSLSALKKMLQPGWLEQPFAERLRHESEQVRRLFQSPVAKELIERFTKKDKP